MQISDKDLFTTANAATETPSDTAQASTAATPPPTPDHDGATGDGIARESTAESASDTAKPKPGAKAKAKTKDKTKSEPGPKAKASSRRSSKDDTANKSDKTETSDLAERLLARFRAPVATLDRRLVPANLLAALDAAGLGGREQLPTAALLSLGMLTAVAGPNLSFEPYPPALRGKLGDAVGIGMRICLLSPHRDLPFVPPAIVAAAYAVQNKLTDLYRSSVDQAAVDRRAAAERRAWHTQATKSAAALGRLGA